MKKWSLRLGIPLLVLAAYHATDAVMTARAVLPPNSGYGRIAIAVLHPPYQMARPHHSLIKSIFTGFSEPSVCASGGPTTCNGYHHHYVQPCQANPQCNIWVCVYTGFRKDYCEFARGTYPCQYCENDADKYCIP
jgi:hypothetical protein